MSLFIVPLLNPFPCCTCQLYVHSAATGFGQTKSSCFSRTLIHHTVIPINLSWQPYFYFKRVIYPSCAKGEDVLPCPHNSLSPPVSALLSPRPFPVSGTEKKMTYYKTHESVHLKIPSRSKKRRQSTARTIKHDAQTTAMSVFCMNGLPKMFTANRFFFMHVRQTVKL